MIPTPLYFKCFLICETICNSLSYEYKVLNMIRTNLSEWNVQTVTENSLIEHHLGLPPGAMGKITYIASEGQYSIQVGIQS